MRIVTWNCCRGDVEQKLAAVRSLNPDVLLLQETKPAARDGGAHYLAYLDGIGIATYTFNGHSVSSVREHENRCGLTVTVGDVDVVNVWTHPLKRYVDSALAVIRATDPDRPTIFAGDFNANAIFGRGYDQLIEELRTRSTRSAYHEFHGADHGSELHPTHYWRWQEASPFHLDYCFVPKSFAVTNVEVGSFVDWKRLSDHRPLAVDMVPASR